MRLLDLLDSAYSTVRYENTYAIAAEDLAYFKDKADLIWEQLAKLYKVAVAQFKENM